MLPATEDHFQIIAVGDLPSIGTMTGAANLSFLKRATAEAVTTRGLGPLKSGSHSFLVTEESAGRQTAC